MKLRHWLLIALLSAVSGAVAGLGASFCLFLWLLGGPK